MAVVRPLAGLRYDPARVGDVGAVLAPPYDVISPDEQEALHERSPWNAVRLILPREADRGASAARTLRSWVERDVLVPDREPALYPYEQHFTFPDGRTGRRRGVICSLRLEEPRAGIVLPHESTFAGPKADRLAIIRATGANLSPIFGLYRRPGAPVGTLLGGALDTPPLLDVVDVQGARHRLWRVTDDATIARFATALAPESVIIADGHHRYETALAYRDEQGTEAARTVLACLTNVEDGVVVLPTHRLVTGTLPPAFAQRLGESFAVSPLGTASRREGEIDCILPGRRLRLRAGDAARQQVAHLPAAIRDLDVTMLRAAILGAILDVPAESLAFTHDDAEAIAAVEEHRATAAFLLNPPTIDQVWAACLAGERMPEKSTYFHPKLATGLVFQRVGPPWV